MQRYGWMIRLHPDRIDEYKAHHERVWPEVLEMIGACSIRNYSIFLKDDTLFGYYEYHGDDHAGDMAAMAAHPKTQEWWSVVGPLQVPLITRRPGEWWALMEEVFHLD